GAARQQAEELDPVARRREQRLEQQVKQQVVAPDVDDERRCGPDPRDVREVLIGADADVHAARDAALLERGRDVQVGALVRDQVVGVELAVWLGELFAERGERRDRLCRRAHLRRGHRDGDGGAHEHRALYTIAPIPRSCHSAILQYYWCPWRSRFQSRSCFPTSTTPDFPRRSAWPGDRPASRTPAPGRRTAIARRFWPAT